MNLWGHRIYLGLRAVAGLFVAGAAVTLLTLPFQFSSLSAPAERSVVLSPPLLLSLKPVQTYLDQLQKHSIFYIPEIHVEKADDGPSVDSILEKYRVIGVVRGAIPSAVIQDSAKKISHLVKPGDSFDGVKVVEIEARTVVIDFEGYRKSLNLQESVL